MIEAEKYWNQTTCEQQAEDRFASGFLMQCGNNDIGEFLITIFDAQSVWA